MRTEAKAELVAAQGATRLYTQCCTLIQTTVPKLLGLSLHLEYKVGGRRSRERIELLSQHRKNNLISFLFTHAK